MRIRFSGFGGQGIVLCGYVFGKAAMLDGNHSLQTQSYGSASRGGLTRSDVCIESGEIFDLAYDEIDVLVAMSQKAYGAYLGDLTPEGCLFYESDMVAVEESSRKRMYGVGATDIAFKSFGNKIIANMIMMGFVNEIVQAVSPDALVQAVRESVPSGTEDKNTRALEKGGELALARS
jgi:2-oxoglutarate ferredoxin oxidoreductase subunit gamma